MNAYKIVWEDGGYYKDYHQFMERVVVAKDPIDALENLKWRWPSVENGFSKMEMVSEDVIVL